MDEGTSLVVSRKCLEYLLPSDNTKIAFVQLSVEFVILTFLLWIILIKVIQMSKATTALKEIIFNMHRVYPYCWQGCQHTWMYHAMWEMTVRRAKEVIIVFINVIYDPSVAMTP